MRAVITGGTGMIGAALTRACISAGHDVVILVPNDLPQTAPLPKSERLYFVDCDVRQLSTFGMNQIGSADAFFHLAWLGTAPNTRNQLQAQANNITYTLDAVDLAHRLGCKAFIGVGSQAEYGRVEGALQPDTPTFPETGYGSAKLAAGLMSRLACKEYGIRHCWARVLSVYGPGDNLHTMVMQVMASACAGNSPNCTKGDQLWDYLYCDDCGRALLAIARHGKNGQVYPVGSGYQRPLSSYIHDICAACNKVVLPNLGAIPYHNNQVMNLKADTTTLCKDTGWQPTVSFNDGIRSTIAWYREVANEQQ